MSSAQNDRCYLGIDIGSVSLAYVLLDQDRQIIQSHYGFHQGNIFSALEELLKNIDLSKVCQVCYNHKSADFFNQGMSANEQVALIEGVKFLINDVGSIFTIGGETFGLILFDEQGHYQKFISNSSCAAGTGAFLDQQAERLGLSGSAELSRLAESFSGEPPKIATRCAVFARTDLIHCQQQGYSIEAIAAGLCKGLAHNITDTLVKGVELREPVVVVGGVSKNKKVIQYISEIIGHPVSIPEHAELAGAIGCALAARQSQPSEGCKPSEGYVALLKKQTKEKHYFFPPLKSEQSIFPNFDDHIRYIFQNVEVDWYNLPQQPGLIPVFLGIDIGSTSTKAIVMAAQKDDQNILLGLYTRTMGQPIKATQALLRTLRAIEEKNNIQFEFCGVGTTGSGRKFIHKILNADLVIDEITAHARAAYALNPKVDSIIEIGGQDSKFTVMKNGQVTFSVMNYVCAAGTGSFIEEQARRLNVRLSEYSELAVGTASPLSSDRCTVFMERDLNYLMSLGYSKPELLAAVLHSVRDNYLSKVAHLNKIGNVICFQGATARNHALVMAFEQKLQKPIFVSKYCHLTGALGVCLLLKEEIEVRSKTAIQNASDSAIKVLVQAKKNIPLNPPSKGDLPIPPFEGGQGGMLVIDKNIVPKSQFRGIDFYKESLTLLNEICDGCKNHCKLIRIRIADEDIVWGYLCGRDESSDGYKPRPKSRFDLLSRRRKIFNPAPILQHPTGDPAEKKLTSLLDELKKISIPVSLEKLKQIDFEATLEKLKQLNLNIPLEKVKQLNLNIPLDKLKQTLSLNLLTLRHRIFRLTQDDIQSEKRKNEITIGIPNTLYLMEHAPFLELFFKKLGYTVKLSSARAEFLESGKEIAGAEFCAPISYWHGHVKNLSGKVDYLFLPHTFEGGEPDNPKFYCYYSNYAVSLVQNIEELNLKDRGIAPIIDFSKPAIHNIQQIYESLPHELKLIQTPGEIQKAYSEAWLWFTEQKQELVKIFQQYQNLFDDISVVLLGRPYLILDEVMNKNIPQKFNDLGVSTFFQDMLPLAGMSYQSPAKEFIEWNHWKFGDTLLKAAAYVGQHGGLYPVILTAFKCSPDSFVINYFKEIMDAYQKPYLILQLDEHGSDVGYETRIEAAIRSFRNHYQQKISMVQRKEPPAILLSHDKQGTVLIPNYDPLSCSLIAAAFEHAGYDALLIEETETSIQSSLRMNDGQCLPISAIAAAAVDTIKKHDLKPEKTAIFLNALTRTSCNFPQYPLMTKKLLEQHGEGFEKVQVFATEFEMRSLPFELIYEVYCSYLLGGFLRKIGCKIRPYEVIPGQTDQLIEASRQKLYQCIKNDESKEDIFRQIVAELAAIPISESSGPRPKVSIIGDLYVRDNDVFNQQLICELENYGAEVVTTPLTYVLRLQAFKHNYNLWEDGHYLTYLRDKLLAEVLEKFEKRFFQIANEIFQEEFPIFDDSIFTNLEPYNLSIQHRGETAQNVMKIFSLLHHYPELKLLIHINPIFCCPGLVSESIFKKIEKDIGIPIVSIIYDGTATRRNEVLAPYLHYIAKLD